MYCHAARNQTTTSYVAVHRHKYVLYEKRNKPSANTYIQRRKRDIENVGWRSALFPTGSCSSRASSSLPEESISYTPYDGFLMWKTLTYTMRTSYELNLTVVHFTYTICQFFTTIFIRVRKLIIEINSYHTQGRVGSLGPTYALGQSSFFEKYRRKNLELVEKMISGISVQI